MERESCEAGSRCVLAGDVNAQRAFHSEQNGAIVMAYP
jgi:hypothetical protein